MGCQASLNGIDGRTEINEIEDSIQQIMDELNPPILSIPGMGVNSAAILAEIGDFSTSVLLTKILAYAGCSPSTYQSGNHKLLCSHGKNAARHLRYALTTQPSTSATEPAFAEYLAKKRAEGKALQCCIIPCQTKKLVRLIYALQKSENISYSCLIFSEPELNPRTT